MCHIITLICHIITHTCHIITHMSHHHTQEARRILDRLAGYTMSPLLWRKISPGLSAGRVQSVGLAMIVRRERERLAFVTADYYDLKANLSTGTGARAFSATLVEAEGKLVASGKARILTSPVWCNRSLLPA